MSDYKNNNGDIGGHIKSTEPAYRTMNNITPIKPVELGKPETHLMQSRLTKGAEGVKPASHVLYEVLALVKELGSNKLKRKVEKIKGK